MRLTRAGILGAVACAAAVATAAVPRIRFTAEAPFQDGGRVEAVWAKADACVRFVEVNTSNVALDQSEARFLFDEKNLYVALTGWYDGQYELRSVEKGMGAVNNFEVFFKATDDYVHVIVDEFGRLYVAKGKNKTENSGVVATVAKVGAKAGKSARWTADLTIPLALVGIAAPTGDRTVKFDVFRANRNVHPRETLHEERLVASGYTPNNYNYGVPDTWADGVMTRADGPAQRVEGPNHGARVNLFANGDFDVPGRGWSPCGKTGYQETMAMSGEWIYRGSGKDYQILTGRPYEVKPGTKYTLVVKARSFGAGSALRIVCMVKDAAGKVKEGCYPTMLTSVGSEMHEYFIPFTSPTDAFWSMIFYKVDNGANDTGLDLAAIKLFEGEISSFEVRKIVRPGRMVLVPGTEIPVKANPIGRFARPIRVAAFISNKYSSREIDEIFAGTGVQFDTLLLTGKDADVYETYGDTKAIVARLTKGEYDLYLVPRLGAEKFGREMLGYIAANVKKGAGLYFEDNPKPGRFAALLADVRDGMYGKGTVTRAAVARGMNRNFRTEPVGDAYGCSFFPDEEINLASLAFAMYRTAVGDAPGVRRETRDYVYAGERHAVTKTLDAAGAVVGWTDAVQPVAGARLGAFADDGAMASVAVEGDCTGVSLAWELRDFSQRILATGEASAAAKVAFALPRQKLYTNMGLVRLFLRKGDSLLDARGEAIYVCGNDRARLMDDFTGSAWPGSDWTDENAQLEQIGIRATVIPAGGAETFARSQSLGFAVGGSWVGDGWTFCGWPQKSNVRMPNFNTAKWRQERPTVVREICARRAKYGILDNGLCDEPNLSRPGSADEVDAHPENLAEYRVRMARKYGTIAEYNRRHQTDYARFDDLGQTLQADARKTGKFAEFIEWRNFNVDRWVEAIRLVSDAARASDPDALFTMCNSFGQSALSGNDYYKLLTRAGLGFSTEYTCMVYFGRSPIFNYDEFIRSFRPDIRCWGWTGYFYSRPRARFMPWWFACHRYGGFNWYAATAPGYNIVDAATAARTVDGQDLKDSLDDSRLLTGLGKVLTCWEWASRDVAIYYSHDSMLLSTILGVETKNGEVGASGPLHDYMHSRQGAQYTVEDLLYQHDFVAPEQVVEQNRLAGVKTLFLPRILAMSDAEVAAVKAYLAKGGRAICDVLPGDYDELGVKRAANPFEGLAGLSVRGANFDDLDATCRADVKAFLEAAGATPALVGAQMLAHKGREAMHYVSGAADFYAVLRMPGRSEDAESDAFTFAKKGHVYDVRVWKWLGETDRVTALVPLNEASVYAVLPARVEGIEIVAPAAIARGGDLRAEFSVRSADVSPAYVLHVEVVPPSGKARFHFQRNLLTANGRARLDFALAHNDEPGTWTLRVTEPLTGVHAEKTFTLTD